MEWLVYLALGALSGLLAGLFGIGGGAIIVPMLVVVFAAMEFAPAQAVHIAVGTSFAAIVFTSLASLRAHQLLGNVRWPVLRAMAPALVLGVCAGAWLASRLQGATLQRAVAVFLFVVALQMLSRWQPPQLFAQAGRKQHVVAGGTIGWVSAFFGIGGGSLTVPYLYACAVPMRSAVATSAACGVPIALFGALSYAYWGGQAGVSEAWTSGFIYWPALVGVGVASVPFAKVGARLAVRLPDAVLRRAFGCLLLMVASYLFIAS
ncbi:MAG: sulfite exporter TauE/SafE family protein [Pseudomonadales bacterium]|nr:sulfite exporter TauE/SafE family protein [Gammaproteobacteria bacterium]NNL57584.1 sulfite exporter TauE/SafE family protein [Pseudomonadales bacterium]